MLSRSLVFLYEFSVAESTKNGRKCCKMKTSASHNQGLWIYGLQWSQKIGWHAFQAAKICKLFSVKLFLFLMRL